MVKAGVVVVNRFVNSGAKEFSDYINYMDRKEASRNTHFQDYNLFNDYMDDPEKSSGLFTEDKSILSESDKSHLKDVFQMAHDNGSLMWQTVFSFDNDWLVQQGVLDEKSHVFNEEKMKEISRGAIRSMLSSENLSNSVWSASFHYNTDNIHVHAAIVEPVPMRKTKEYTQYQYVDNPEGDFVKLSNGQFVKANNRNNVNRYGVPLARYDRIPLIENGEIVKKEEYVGQFKLSSLESAKKYFIDNLSVERDNNILINKLIRDQIVKTKRMINLSEDQDLARKFIELHKSLPRNVNRGLWKYNGNVMAPLRKQIDELSDLYLQKYHAKDVEKLQQLLIKQSDVFRTAYGNTGRDFYENKMKELHERLGNAILAELRNYDRNVTYSVDELDASAEKDYLNSNQGITKESEMNFSASEKLSEDTVYEMKSDEPVISPDLKTEDGLEHFNNFKGASDPEGTSSFQQDSEYADFSSDATLGQKKHFNGCICEWTSDYKKAMDLIYQEKPDYDKAINLLRSQAKINNVLAVYELGNIYKYGRGVEKDIDKSNEYFSRSFQMFQEIERNLNRGAKNYNFLKSFINYRMGKQCHYGLGVEKNISKAIEHYSISDSSNSNYSLATIYFFGDDVNIDYEAALYHYERSIEIKDNAYAELKLAKMYELGLGVKADQEVADKYYKLAFKDFTKMLSDKKDDQVLYALAKLHLEGKGTEKNLFIAEKYLLSIKDELPMVSYCLGTIYLDKTSELFDAEKGISYLQKGAESGDQFIQLKLGLIYFKGELIERDIDKAQQYLKLSADAGNKMAQYAVSKIYLDKSSKFFDIEKGISYLQQSAEAGYVYSNLKLGLIYYKGQIQDYDINKAEHYLLRAAEEENHVAQYVLGKIYTDKDCKLFDPKKGIEYFEKAADAGNEFAQIKLVQIYSKGELVKADQKKAKQFLLGVEKSKDPNVQYEVGKIYLDKSLKFYNLKKGLSILEQSAEGENEFAQLKLGMIYLQGNLVNQDINKAKKYFERAKENGNEIAADILKNLKNGSYFKVKRKAYVMRSLEASLARLRRNLDNEKEKALNMRIYYENEKEQRQKDLQEDFDM